MSAPIFARPREVVDVEERELRASGEQQLDAVGRRRLRRDG